MAFRADEAQQRGHDGVISYLVSGARELNETQRARSRDVLERIIDRLGPVVESYPSWHPLVRNHNSRFPVTTPSEECGYRGLDHTRFFANGFITCPYDDGQSVIDSVTSLQQRPEQHPAAYVSAERLDIKIYHPEVTPILVTCEWDKPLLKDRTIPLATAMPLILEQEIPCCRWAEFAETWETMRPYFLGSPHGSRSSLFVNQETGQGIKNIWNALIHTGMFGPIKVGIT